MRIAPGAGQSNITRKVVLRVIAASRASRICAATRSAVVKTLLRSMRHLHTRDGHRRHEADDPHHDHQLDQGESTLVAHDAARVSNNHAACMYEPS